MGEVLKTPWSVSQNLDRVIYKYIDLTKFMDVIFYPTYFLRGLSGTQTLLLDD